MTNLFKTLQNYFLIHTILTISGCLSQIAKIEAEDEILHPKIKNEILNVPNTNETVRVNNVGAFACGVNQGKPIPTQFTNCMDFCNEVCDNNMAIEVGGTNYQSCRCTVFNNAVVNAGCCTGEFQSFDSGESGYTCEDDICSACFGEAICYRLKAGSSGESRVVATSPPLHQPNSATIVNPFTALVIIVVTFLY